MLSLAVVCMTELDIKLFPAFQCKVWTRLLWWYSLCPNSRRRRFFQKASCKTQRISWPASKYFCTHLFRVMVFMHLSYRSSDWRETTLSLSWNWETCVCQILSSSAQKKWWQLNGTIASPGKKKHFVPETATANYTPVSTPDFMNAERLFSKIFWKGFRGKGFVRGMHRTLCHQSTTLMRDTLKTYWKRFSFLLS